MACVKLLKFRPLMTQFAVIGHLIFVFKQALSSIQLMIHVVFALQSTFEAKHEDGSRQFMIHCSSFCWHPIVVSLHSSSTQSIISPLILAIAVHGWIKCFSNNKLHYYL